jgi:threonine dehydratase
MAGGRPTPLERFSDSVWLKREDVHELGSFKWRGATALIEALEPEVLVTASTGNHGAATAWAARRAGIRAIVFVPEEVSATKLALIEANGGEVHRVGADLDEAKDAARALAEAEGHFWFEDGEWPAQWWGYSAIAEDLVEQLGEPPGAVVTPVGNGALAIGVGAALQRDAPDAVRVGVVAAAAPVMADSWEAGRPVEGRECATFADGMAVRVAIPHAVEELAWAVQRMVRVSEQELARAVAEYGRAGIRVEGAAAASLAALRQLGSLPEPVVLIVTGRNIDDALYASVLASAQT